MGWVFAEILCHSLNFVNMRELQLRLYFFPTKFYKSIYCLESLLQNFSISFLLSHMFPWMNKYSFLHKIFFSIV